MDQTKKFIEKNTETTKKPRKIIAAQLHVSQKIAGQVRGAITTEHPTDNPALLGYKVEIREVPNGLSFIDKDYETIVPFGNIQSYKYALED